MVLVSHRKKFIFMKTAKTASTSVEVLLQQWCRPRDTPNPVAGIETSAGVIGQRGIQIAGDLRWRHHMTPSQVRRRLSPEVWDSYFKFTVVREPFDWAVSRFEYQRKRVHRGHLVDDPQLTSILWPSVDDTRDDHETFEHWANLMSTRPPEHRRTYCFEDELCLDYYARFEDLNDDIAAVCDRIGVATGQLELPKLKTSLRDRSRTLASYYTSASVDAVRSIYERDFEDFGYPIDPPFAIDALP